LPEIAIASKKSFVTPKQVERIRKKIASIRQALAAERRKFGWYDDGRGLRYLPPELYLKIGDYKGGLTYLKWFEKNFPDDSGYPPFLFEWTIILFKNGKLEEAERKAFKTFCANTYLFDAFFGNPITVLPIKHWSNWEEPGLAEELSYSNSQPELTDFSAWLLALTSSEKFIALKYQYLSILEGLTIETDFEKRRALSQQKRQLY
jgi:hypothetical protein